MDQLSVVGLEGGYCIDLHRYCGLRLSAEKEVRNVTSRKNKLGVVTREVLLLEPKPILRKLLPKLILQTLRSAAVHCWAGCSAGARSVFEFEPLMPVGRTDIALAGSNHKVLIATTKRYFRYKQSVLGVTLRNNGLTLTSCA